MSRSMRKPAQSSRLSPGYRLTRTSTTATTRAGLGHSASTFSPHCQARPDWLQRARPKGQSGLASPEEPQAELSKAPVARAAGWRPEPVAELAPEAAAPAPTLEATGLQVRSRF